MDGTGAPPGYSGDPAGGNKTCNTSGCHTGATVGTLTGIITSNIPTSGYTPGTSYTVTANFVRAGHAKYGFEISPQNPTGTLLGTLALLNTQTKLMGNNKYITHTNTGTAGTGSKTWNFRWTAPATGLGPVTFYGAFNATNSNNSDTGDSIFRSTLVVTEAPSAVSDLYTDHFSLSTFPNPTYDDLNVAFILSEPSSVEMELISLNGSKIKTLFSENDLNGEISESFDISSYPKGVYFLRLKVGSSQSLKKVVKL